MLPACGGLDEALVLGGEGLEGVDQAGVEELGRAEVGQLGGEVLLLGQPPHRRDDGHLREEGEEGE